MIVKRNTSIARGETMKNIVGVRFKKPGKIYFFDPRELNINKDSFVIVDTASRRRVWRGSYSE